MSLRFSLPTLLIVAFCLPASAALAQEVLSTGTPAAAKVIEVSVFGRPSTAFSKKPVNTTEELLTGLMGTRDDLVAILDEVKSQTSGSWDSAGLADGIINSVRQGNVKEASFPVGTELDWMASRKYRKPRVLWNIRWKGKEAFDAWIVETQQDNMIYTFVIPKKCMNLSMSTKDDSLKPRMAVVPPTCSLDANWSLPSNDVTVKLEATGADTVVMSGLEGTGPSWTFQAPSEGSHTFSATVTNAAGEATCSDSVTVTWPEPNCTLSATLTDERSGASEVRASGEFDDITLFTALPNGAAGSAPTSAGARVWTYDPRDDGRRAGVYTFSGDVRNRFGKTAQCTAASYEVPRLEKWIVRGFGGRYDGDAESVLVNTPTLREKSWVDAGQVFGASIEYKPTDKLGVELGVMFAKQDAHWEYDDPTRWLMDEESLKTRILTLGVNWHLLDPAAPVDLFIGPFVGQASFNNLDFADGSLTRRVDYDSEVIFGAQLGLGVPFGDSPVSFQAGIKYLQLDAEDDNFNLGIDPLIATAGIGIRF